MKSRLVVAAISMAVIMVLGLFAAITRPVSATTTYGPRIDQLLCNMYTGSGSEFVALQTGNIDIIDTPLTPDMVPVINSTPGCTLDQFKGSNMFEFDLNNNQTISSYPGIQIPTYDANFRIAIAYMVDKPYIVNVILGGLGVQLEAPLLPWLQWYDPAMTTYSYNPSAACTVLYNNGWRNSPDPNVVTNVHFPASWPQLPSGPNVAGLDLVTVFNKTNVGFGVGSGPGLIFVRRSDDINRYWAGGLLIYGDATHKGLTSIGIPVDDFHLPKQTCLPIVMYKKNFMVYTGDWSLSRNPDYVFDLYNPYNYDPNPNNFAQNYDNVNDPVLNADEFNVKLALTTSAAQTACHDFCDRWGQIEPMICLWANVGYYAHKNTVHVLNADTYSIPSWWNLYCMNIPLMGVTGGLVRWGFASDVQMLNVIYSSSTQDWQVLDEIYDTLIRCAPFNVGLDMPWMASSWTVGNWTVPSGDNAGNIGTTVNFTLNSGIDFVNPVTGTVYGSVTPADVAFSLQYTTGNVAGMHMHWLTASQTLHAHFGQQTLAFKYHS